MEVMPGYKLSDVGVIPQDWKDASLGEIAEIRMCKRIFLEQTKPTGDIPFFKIGTFGKMPDAYISFDIYRAYKRKYSFPHRGDILLSAAGTLGKTVIYDGVDAYFQDSNIVWLDIDQEKITNEYLFQCYQKIKWDSPEGSTISRLYNGIIRNTKIPLPPTIKEQRDIAQALSDVDTLIESVDRLIVKKRNFKQAAMQQLLTGQTRLPGFSGGWENKKLSDVATLVRINIIPWLRPKDSFVHFSLPAFDEGKMPVVETGSAIGSNKFKVPKDAVLVSKLNPRIPRVWEPTEIPENSVASTEFLVLIPKLNVSRKFLFVLCASPAFCEQMELAATGTTGSHQRISPTGALNLNFFVPTDTDEQTAIAGVLTSMDAYISALEDRRNKTAALKQGMMQELLTGRTRLV